MNKQIVNRIAELRNAKSFSQEQVAEKIGISRQKYARIENGINSVTLEILVKLANVFDVTVKDITKVLEQEASVAYRSGEQKQSTRDMLYMIDLFYANKRLYEKLTYQDKE